MKNLRIYLDNCSYNRPFDDQTQIVISLETNAKLYIQKLVTKRKLDLVFSFISVTENDMNRYKNRRNYINDFFSNSVQYIDISYYEQIKETISEIMAMGIKNKDATHIACAILGNCQYLITTDKRMLKYKSDKITLINPIDFVCLLGG